MADKRGQFTASIALHIDDSKLNKETKAALDKISKMTEMYDKPVDLELAKDYSQMVIDFKKLADIPELNWDVANVEHVKTVLNEMGVAAIKSTEDINKLWAVMQTMLAGLHQGNAFDPEALFGVSSKVYAGMLDIDVKAAEKQVDKNVKNVSKILKDKYDKYLLSRSGDVKSKVNAAQELYAAALYTQDVSGKPVKDIKIGGVNPTALMSTIGEAHAFIKKKNQPLKRSRYDALQKEWGRDQIDQDQQRLEALLIERNGYNKFDKYSADARRVNAIHDKLETKAQIIEEERKEREAAKRARKAKEVEQVQREALKAENAAKKSKRTAKYSKEQISNLQTQFKGYNKNATDENLQQLAQSVVDFGSREDAFKHLQGIITDMDKLNALWSEVVKKANEIQGIEIKEDTKKKKKGRKSPYIEETADEAAARLGQKKAAPKVVTTKVTEADFIKDIQEAATLYIDADDLKKNKGSQDYKDAQKFARQKFKLYGDSFALEKLAEQAKKNYNLNDIEDLNLKKYLEKSLYSKGKKEYDFKYQDFSYTEEIKKSEKAYNDALQRLIAKYDGMLTQEELAKLTTTDNNESSKLSKIYLDRVYEGGTKVKQSIDTTLSAAPEATSKAVNAENDLVEKKKENQQIEQQIAITNEQSVANKQQELQVQEQLNAAEREETPKQGVTDFEWYDNKSLEDRIRLVKEFYIELAKLQQLTNSFVNESDKLMTSITLPMQKEYTPANRKAWGGADQYQERAFTDADTGYIESYKDLNFNKVAQDGASVAVRLTAVRRVLADIDQQSKDGILNGTKLDHEINKLAQYVYYCEDVNKALSEIQKKNVDLYNRVNDIVSGKAYSEERVKTAQDARDGQYKKIINTYTPYTSDLKMSDIESWAKNSYHRFHDYYEGYSEQAAIDDAQRWTNDYILPVSPELNKPAAQQVSDEAEKIIEQETKPKVEMTMDEKLQHAVNKMAEYKFKSDATIMKRAGEFIQSYKDTGQPLSQTQLAEFFAAVSAYKQKTGASSVKQKIFKSFGLDKTNWDNVIPGYKELEAEFEKRGSEFKPQKPEPKSKKSTSKPKTEPKPVTETTSAATEEVKQENVELAQSLDQVEEQAKQTGTSVQEAMQKSETATESTTTSVKELVANMDAAEQQAVDTGVKIEEQIQEQPAEQPKKAGKTKKPKKPSPYDIKAELLRAASVTDGLTIDETSIKQSSTGIIYFTAQIKELNGDINESKVQIKELFDIMSGDKIDIAKLKDCAKTIQTIESVSKSDKQPSSVKNIAEQVSQETDDLKTTLDNYKKVFGNLRTDNIRGVGAGLDYQTVDGLSRAVALYDKLTGKTKLTAEETDAYTKELNELIATFKQFDVESAKLFSDKYGKYIGDAPLESGRKLASYIGHEAEVQNALKKMDGAKYGIEGQISDVQYNSKTHMAKITTKDNNLLRSYSVKLVECARGANNLSIEMRNVGNVTKKTMSTGMKWLDGLKKKFASLTQYMTGHTLLMRVFNEFREGATFVKELDSLMTTVYQTMDITREGLTELSQGAIDTAKALGTTTDQVTQAIGIYAAYGETVDSILSKSSPTVMLANAAGVDVSTASDQIQGVLQQYQELEGQEMRIVNSYEKIAANVQIDFDKGIASISEGVANAGSVAENAGLSFEQFAASVAKVAERTRQEGSQIGNAYKTIMSRVSRSKDADEDTTLEDRSDAAKSLAAIGIQVYDDAGTYQDFSKTLDQLAAKWETLTDAQRANIAESMAGVRNINTMQAIIDTWGEAKQLANDALTDTGYAQEVQDKYMESMQAHLNSLKAAGQDFWYTLLDTGVINDLLSFATGLVKTFDKLLEIVSNIGGVFGSWGSTIAVLASTFGALFGAGRIWDSIKDVFSSSVQNEPLDENTRKTKENSAAQEENEQKREENARAAAQQGVSEKVETEITEENTREKNENTVAETVNSGAETQGAVTSGLATAGEMAETDAINANTDANTLNTISQNANNASEAAGAVTSAINAGTKGMGNSLIPKFAEKTISGATKVFSKLASVLGITTVQLGKFIAIGVGVTATAGAIVAAFDAATVSTAEAKETVEELNSSYEEAVNTLKNNKSTIDSISEEFAALSKGVNIETGSNISLTTDELKRYREICNQIATMYPSVVKSYDAQGNAILNLKGTVEELNDVYNQQRLNAAKDNLGAYDANSGTYENLGTYLKNFSNVTGNRTAGTKAWDIFSSDLFGAAEIGGRLTAQEAADILQEVQGMSYDEIKKWAEEQKKIDYSKYLWFANETGFSLDTTQTMYNGGEYTIAGTTQEEWAQMQKELPSRSAAILQEVSDATNSLRNGMQEYLTVLQFDNAEFAEVDGVIFDQVSNMITNSSSEMLEQFANNEQALQNYIQKWLRTLDNDAYQVNFSNLLNLDKDATIEEIDKVISDNLPKLANALGYEDEKEIAALVEQLGLEDIKELIDGYEESVQDISDILNENNGEHKDTVKYHKQIKKFIKDEKINTKEELDVLKKCTRESKDWAEVMAKYASSGIHIATNASEIDDLEANLTQVEKTIDSIGEAIQASNSAQGLSGEQIDNIVEAFSDLGDEFNYDQLFESTAEGVRLNAQELDRLVGLYEDMESAKYDNMLVDLQEQYSDVCVAIGAANNVTEKNRLINQRNDLTKQIQQVQELKSRYAGLTNAVTKYQQAKANGEDGDTYLDIHNDIEEIEKLYKNGLVGTNQFQAAVQMMTNKDMSGASIQDYINEYNAKMPQFKSWFTEDASGLQTFLYDVMALDPKMASVDKNGFWTINADIEEMANGLGVSQAIIQEIFKRLKDFGFDVDFKEESEHLKALRSEAQTTFDTIDAATKEQYSLNMDATSIEDVDQQMANLDLAIKDAVDNGDEELARSLRAIKDYYKALKGESAEISVDVNTKEGIAKLEQAAADLKEKANIEINIDWGATSAKYYKNQIDDLTDKVKNLEQIDGKINMEAPGAQEAYDLLLGLQQKKQQLDSDSNISLNVDTDKLSGEVRTSVQDLIELQNASYNLKHLLEQQKLGFPVDTKELTDAKQKVQDLAEEFATVHPEATATLNTQGIDLASQEVTDISDKLTAMEADTTLIAFGVDPKLVDGYIAKEKKGAGTVVWDNNAKAVNTYANTHKYAYGTVVWSNDTSRVKTPSQVKNNSNPLSSILGQVNGNAHVEGNAHPTLLQRGMALAQGVWGAAKNASSLVGELGRELVVRGNRWFTVGDNGAEFTDIKKGDIVFNHKQTEEIFKNGYVTSGGGRGNMANSSGNAYLEGNAYNVGVSGTFTSTGALAGSNKFYNDALNFASGAGDAVDAFKEVMDWIEILIDRIEREIQTLDTIAGSAYKNFTKRNQTLIKEFGRVADEIELQQAAYDAYIKRAESVSLSEEYKQKIRDGKLQIEDITDEKLKEKIDDFSEWYEKAIDCRDAIVDLEEQLGDIAKSNFDLVTAEFDALIAKIEDAIELTEGGLDMVEAKGQFASKRYFETLMSTEKENIAMIEKEYVALQQAYKAAMDSGAIEVGSEAYYEMQQQIRDVEKSLQDANLALVEYKNDMWEMDWSAFEYGQSLIEELTKESEFLIDLLSFNENDLFSKVNGKLTDSGFAVAGLHAMDYNVYMAQAEEYEKKMKEVNAELAKDPTNTILIDKKNEYLDAQREAIRNANDEKMAVHDLIEESYNKMLEILQELIDKRKDLLSAEKDWWFYVIINKITVRYNTKDYSASL